MKKVRESAECGEVRNSTFMVQRHEKHENQMKGYAVELKVSDWQMNAWTLWSCSVWTLWACNTAAPLFLSLA